MKTFSRSKALKDFHGIILADKKTGITSYDLIRKIKKVFSDTVIVRRVYSILFVIDIFSTV